MNKMEFIPLFVPDINDQDIAAVNEVLRSGMLVQGKNVLALENAFIENTGAGFAKAVSNGTATLHVMLKAAGIGPGDEVIVPAFSYIATANVVELVGATPVFVDIDIETFNIDVDQIQDKISAKTKAIMVVHEFGLSADMDAILKIAQEIKLILFEDAACALGAKYNGKHVGTFGLAGSFSLHPRKAVTSGEGGVVLTDDEYMAEKIDVLRNHGIRMEAGKMNFVDAGFNYRLTDFQAALVNSQLPRLQRQIERKRGLAKIYAKELDREKIKLPGCPKYCEHTWQTFHVLVNETTDRDSIISKLKERGIGASYGAQCMPSQTYFYNKYKLDSATLYPNALKAFEKGLALPLYSALNEEQIHFISRTLNEII